MKKLIQNLPVELTQVLIAGCPDLASFDDGTLQEEVSCLDR